MLISKGKKAEIHTNFAAAKKQTSPIFKGADHEFRGPCKY